jgi:hypothetical protein
LTLPCTQEKKIDAIYSAIVGDLTTPGIRSLLADMQADQELLKKVVFGNGKPGLVETVNGLRIQHEGEEKSWGKNVAVSTLVLTNLIAIAGIVFQFYGKH